MASLDLNFQNISSVQSNQQLGPNTIASTTTIAPTSFITFVSGSVAIATITPPFTGQGAIVLIPSSATAPTFTTAGNIKAALTTMAQNIPVLLVYDPNGAKWYAN